MINSINNFGTIQFGFRKVSKAEQQAKLEARRLERREKLARIREEKLKRKLSKIGPNLEKINRAVTELIKRAGKLRTSEISVLKGDWPTLLSMGNLKKIPKADRDQLARHLLNKRDYQSYLQDPHVFKLGHPLTSFLRQLSSVKSMASGDLVNKLLCQKLAQGSDVSIIFERMFSGKYPLDLRPQIWKRNFLRLKQLAKDTVEYGTPKHTIPTLLSTLELMPLKSLNPQLLPIGNGQLELEVTFSDPADKRTHKATLSRKSLADWLDTNKRISNRADDISVNVEIQDQNGKTAIHTGKISTLRLVGLLKRAGIVPSDYKYVTSLSHYPLMSATISIKTAEPRARTYGLKPGFVSQVVPQWLKRLTGYQENRDDWGIIQSITIPKPIDQFPSSESQVIKGLLMIQDRLNQEALRRIRVVD